MKKRLVRFLSYLLTKLDKSSIVLHRSEHINLEVSAISSKVDSEKENVVSEELIPTLEILPLDGIEENILPLVKLINDMPGIYTSESCGGHEDPKFSQAKQGSWYVIFRIDSHHEQGFSSLAYLTYFFNTFCPSMNFDTKLQLISRKTNNIDPILSLMVKVEGNDIPVDLISRLLEDMMKYDFDLETLEAAILQENDKCLYPF